MSNTPDEILKSFAISTHEIKPGEDEQINFDKAKAQLEVLIARELKKELSYVYKLSDGRLFYQSVTGLPMLLEERLVALNKIIEGK